MEENSGLDWKEGKFIKIFNISYYENALVLHFPYIFISVFQ